MGSHRRLTTPDAYLRAVRGFAVDGRDPARVVRAVAASLLLDRGIEPPEAFRSALDHGDEPPPLPSPEVRSPWLLGQVHEALMDASARRRAGAHYTPIDVARRLVAFARAGHAVTAPVVCDPAVGGGVFLLAAAESLAVEGIEPATVVAHHLHGVDVDPLAVDITRAALATWAGTWPPQLDEHVVVADALRSAAPHPGSARCDLVVGNPPFQSQLAADTARGRAGTDELRARFGDAAKGYVDNAALFLLASLDLVNPGGRVSLVQPHSTLATRDSAGVRSAVLDRARLAGLWFTTERLFSAGVRVWAPVLERHGTGDRNRTEDVEDEVARRIDAGFDAVPSVAPPQPDDGSWAPLVADLTGTPAVAVHGDGCIGDLATATAGFRDQYYGLVGAVHEHVNDGGPRDTVARLVTSGLVEPLVVAWGTVPVRFAGERWLRPVVRLDQLTPDIRRWVVGHLVPKLVVATQTRVLEVAVDEHGDVVPSTPVIAVHAPTERLWHVAAALSAPPISALALRSSIGTALSADAVKLSARQVLALPLPKHRAAWDTAAELARAVAHVDGRDAGARQRALVAYGTAACAAYGVGPDPVLAWWLERVTTSGRERGNGSKR